MACNTSDSGSTSCNGGVDNNNGRDFKIAMLFSIFESTPEHILHRALADANNDLEQAILILSSNSNSHDCIDGSCSPSSSPSSALPVENDLVNVAHASNNSNNSGSSHTFSRSSSKDVLPPKNKKQKLIQPRLSTFLPSNGPTLLFRSEPKDLTDQKSSDANNMPLTSINDRLRWKEKPYDPTSPSPPSATNSSTMLSSSSSSSSGPSTRKSAPKPLILYSPEDVERHCPCTLVFNVLSKDLATRLLQAMLIDSETWDRNRWWFFERMVESPHKRSYFAEHDDDMEEIAGWTYNGQKQEPPRRFLKEMEEAKLVIRKIVNDLRKTRAIHPYEVQGDWNCNVAAANYYAHSKESVGWHADKLTYLGPRPTIGSLTLGATRFFRVRKMVPDVRNPDTAGQLISIALPHNSLCIMWPPMQEEWKHEVPPQARVTPHPISGTARINITFRLRREGFSPADTPVCKCGIAMVLRCVFKNKANYGRYFYMCYASGSQEGRTCGAFQWVDMEEKLGLVKKYSTSLSNSSSPSSPSSLPCLPSPSNTCTSITPPSTSISSTTASTTVAVTVETTLESAGKPEAVNSNEKKLSMSQPAICDMSKVKDQIEDKEQDQALDLANELDDADLVDLADLSFEGISESDFAE